ncbi:MAG: twin-arginine translocase subunit TatC [Nitriliruptorales bacterium]|nr:twin-arginine translocase subunit TatC [Nitriliruptorales bacterium]
MTEASSPDDEVTGASDEARGSIVGGEMTLVEHLAELRNRLFKAALALTAGAVVGYALFPQVLDLIIAPYCGVPTAFRPDPEGPCRLIATRALEPFSVRIKTSLVIGLLLGGPVIFYQLWKFITPGLTQKERRYSLPFVVLSQVMFAAGMAFAYLIIPQGLRILLGFGGETITPLLSAGEYLSFFLTTAVAFGVIFEIPLVLVFLSLIGVVTAAQLRRFRPYALVLNVALAALVTPTTDAVTLLFMAVPMALFYEGAIVAAWLIERSRRRGARAGRTSPA